MCQSPFSLHHLPRKAEIAPDADCAAISRIHAGALLVLVMPAAAGGGSATEVPASFLVGRGHDRSGFGARDTLCILRQERCAAEVCVLRHASFP